MAVGREMELYADGRRKCPSGCASAGCVSPTWSHTAVATTSSRRRRPASRCSPCSPPTLSAVPHRRGLVRGLDARVLAGVPRRARGRIGWLAQRLPRAAGTSAVLLAAPRGAAERARSPRPDHDRRGPGRSPDEDPAPAPARRRSSSSWAATSRRRTRWRWWKPSRGPRPRSRATREIFGDGPDREKVLRLIGAAGSGRDDHCAGLCRGGPGARDPAPRPLPPPFRRAGRGTASSSSRQRCRDADDRGRSPDNAARELVVDGENGVVAPSAEPASSRRRSCACMRRGRRCESRPPHGSGATGGACRSRARSRQSTTCTGGKRCTRGQRPAPRPG